MDILHRVSTSSNTDEDFNSARFVYIHLEEHPIYAGIRNAHEVFIGDDTGLKALNPSNTTIVLSPFSLAVCIGCISPGDFFCSLCTATCKATLYVPREKFPQSTHPP